MKPVVGFRVWRPERVVSEFSVSRPSLALWPLTSLRGPWVRGVNTSHDLPREADESSSEYRPGLYSYHSLSSIEWGPVEPLIAGVTLNWGVLSLGPALSLAAEHAQILALLEHERSQDPRPFAAAYGVPVVPFEHADAWAQEFGDTIPADSRMLS